MLCSNTSSEKLRNTHVEREKWYDLCTDGVQALGNFGLKTEKNSTKIYENISDT